MDLTLVLAKGKIKNLLLFKVLYISCITDGIYDFKKNNLFSRVEEKWASL